jgi:hypothetical protein
MSQVQPSKNKRLWYACELIGTNSLKEGAINIHPLLGKGSVNISTIADA